MHVIIIYNVVYCFGGFMEEFIVSFMNQYGYFGIFFLIFVENVFPPIPSEVVLLFGGFMTTYSKLNVSFMILFSTLGSVFGAIVLYYVGKLLNKERLKKFVSGRVGTILRLNDSDIEKADSWFDRKGNKTVFFCRFIPVVRSLISIPAGMSEMAIGKFLIYTISGSAIWNTILLVIGNRVGKKWKDFLNIIDQYSHIIFVVFILLFIAFVIYFYFHGNQKNKK